MPAWTLPPLTRRNGLVPPGAAGRAALRRGEATLSIAVGLGLNAFPFSGARAFWRWVDLCEEGGVDSLWQTDRLVSDEPFLEVMSVMAALAGRTERIKFGMNVASVGLRDPLLLAKQCATIDVLSEGRLLPAFGIGAIRAPDWAATGTDTKGRGRRTDEALELIARLWTEDSVDFDGEFYRYAGARIEPKPVQAALPLWLGGSSKPAIRRTARIGTGWDRRAGDARAGGTGHRRDQGSAPRRPGGVSTPTTTAQASTSASAVGTKPMMQRMAETYAVRFQRDPKGGIVAGDAADIMQRVEAFSSRPARPSLCCGRSAAMTTTFSIRRAG